MWSLFQNAGFRRLWASMVVLALGDALMQMGLLELFRTHQYDERVETAKMLFAVALPGLLLGPVAMAYLDRWQRRTVLMVSDAFRVLVVLGIALWLQPLLTGRVEERHLWVVYSLIFVIGAVTTFYYPARYALLPNLIGKERLVQANTLFAVTLAVTTVGGRALGGFVAETCGVQVGVLTNAVAYMASVVLLWRIKMPAHATAQDANGRAPGGWEELRTGLMYLARHRTALPLVWLAGVFAFLLGVLVVALVGYALNTLGLRTGGLGYLIGAGGVGAAIGLAAFGRGKPWTKSEWVPFVQLVLGGVALWLMSRTAEVWRVVPLMVALGAVGATVMIFIDAKMQEQVEETRRGAVFAARGMLTSLTMLVAFWLQFGTKFFQETPSETILEWLGIGAVASAVLTLAAMRWRR